MHESITHLLAIISAQVETKQKEQGTCSLDDAKGNTKTRLSNLHLLRSEKF